MFLNKNKNASRSSSSRGDGCQGGKVNMRKYFKCIYTNATSLNNKLSHLRVRVALEDPYVIKISETWFNENSCPNIEGYTIFRGDRVGSRGGGVCIYVKCVYNPTEVSEDSGLSDPSIEAVWCSCSMNSEKILVGCLFRPGDASERETGK